MIVGWFAEMVMMMNKSQPLIDWGSVMLYRNPIPSRNTDSDNLIMAR